MSKHPAAAATNHVPFLKTIHCYILISLTLNLGPERTPTNAVTCEKKNKYNTDNVETY